MFLTLFIFLIFCCCKKADKNKFQRKCSLNRPLLFLPVFGDWALVYEISLMQNMTELWPKYYFCFNFLLPRSIICRIRNMRHLYGQIKPLWTKLYVLFSFKISSYVSEVKQHWTKLELGWETVVQGMLIPVFGHLSKLMQNGEETVKNSTQTLLDFV